MDRISEREVILDHKTERAGGGGGEAGCESRRVIKARSLL